MQYFHQHKQAIHTLLALYGVTLVEVDAQQAIPGSFWGESEAGLIKNSLYVQANTPIHSLLHEFCHYLCMDQTRRDQLHTDAGGSDLEESAVCYLQCLLAKQIPALGQAQLFADMDDWGYSFRLGNTQTWFEQDANDALLFLVEHKLSNNNGIVCLGQARL